MIENLYDLQNVTVLNVVDDTAKPEYKRGQDRLIESCKKYRINHIYWRGDLPKNSPSHSNVPYAFKIFAIRQIWEEYKDKGHSGKFLWLDSPCWFIKNPTKLFEEIHNNSILYWAVGLHNPLSRYCSDAALKVFNLTRIQARNIPLIQGNIFALNLQNKDAMLAFNLIFHYYKLGAFVGPSINSNSSVGKHSLYSAGFRGRPEYACSNDEECWGHRHDESVMSFIFHTQNLGKKLLPGTYFDSWENSHLENVCIVSRGC